MFMPLLVHGGQAEHQGLFPEALVILNIRWWLLLDLPACLPALVPLKLCWQPSGEQLSHRCDGATGHRKDIQGGRQGE